MKKLFILTTLTPLLTFSAWGVITHKPAAKVDIITPSVHIITTGSAFKRAPEAGFRAAGLRSDAQARTRDFTRASGDAAAGTTATMRDGRHNFTKGSAASRALLKKEMK